MTKKSRRVALVGSASSTKDLAPWGDPTFEIWGLAWRKDLKRATRVFDMHPLDGSREAAGKIPKDYTAHLNAYNCPVYLLQAYSDVPESVTYPIEEVTKFLAGFDPVNNGGNYFASSIAYMLALALYEGVDEIHLYGIDLIDDEEYMIQRPNTEYLIGLARGRGVRVYIPPQSALLKHAHQYGYESKNKESIITIDVLEQRVAQYKQRMDRALAEAHTCDGAIQECQGLITIVKHTQRGVKREQPTSDQVQTNLPAV